MIKKCPMCKNVKNALQVMFDKQVSLQIELGTYDKINEDVVMRQMFIDRMLLACHEEIDEIARESFSKSTMMPFGWKKSQEFNREKFMEEIVDLWHFTMNLWISVDGTADEFFNLYLKKNKINHQRNNGDY